jgi:hypothetical protein
MAVEVGPYSKLYIRFRESLESSVSSISLVAGNKFERHRVFQALLNDDLYTFIKNRIQGL